MELIMITKENIEYVAALAKLKIEEEKIEKFTQDLEQIINFADKLNQLDTNDVETTAHSVPLYNVFRKDEVIPSLKRDEILKNSPQKDEEFYIIPNVVE